jgi:hypothetical protein
MAVRFGIIFFLPTFFAYGALEEILQIAGG